MCINCDTTIDRYPLLPIKDHVDYTRATAVVEDLFGRDDLDAVAEGYLDTLIKLVSDYEDQHHAIADNMTPAEVVKALMTANGMKVKDLAEIIGSQPAASDFLAGRRGLSKMRAKRLAERFKMEISAFL